MRRSLSAALFLIVLTVSFASAFAEGPALSGEMEARRIIRDEKDHEIAVPAEQVYPNDTVEYTLKYNNSGEASVTGVGLVGPVPTGTIYIEKTASDIAGITTLYSIDGGKSYQKAPVMYEFIRKDGTVEKRVAKPEMITHIKWAVDGEFDPGRVVQVSYRVQVK
ncbi:MAG TPA: hypothetical protein VLA34_09845 [Candidatus Krumholzibacterium sp.]|nr:hypothetical protein [Candidatus Krumholzibacterium sp.]